MGLPVSGFPNMNAVSLEDATGQNYVDTLDFLKVCPVAFVRGQGATPVTSVAAHHAVVQNLAELLLCKLPFNAVLTLVWCIAQR